MLNKNQYCSCCILNIFISLVIAVIIGGLFALGFVPFIITAIWIAFGLSVLVLIFLVWGLYLATTNKSEILSKCLIGNATCLLIGIIGTILTSLTALSIFLIPPSTLDIILVTIGGFFFTFMILGLISFIQCILYGLYINLTNC